MKRVLMGALVAACVCLAGSLAADDAKAPAKKAVAKKAAPPAYRIWAASEMKWVDAEAAKGVSGSVLWGDPAKGEYGAMQKFVAGTDMGWHTHTNRVRLVVVSGTMTIEVQGQPVKELGPGSFADDPGGVVHRTRCNAGQDCIFFVHQHGKFDLIPFVEKK